MLRKIATIFVVILLLPVFTYAQEYTVLKPDGKIIKISGKLHIVDAQRIKKRISGNLDKQNINSSVSTTVLSPDGGTIDTLKLTPPWDTSFRFNSQDVMLQWFVAPADLTLMFAGFSTVDNAGADLVELKIVRVEWPEADLKTAGTVHHGWYEAVGNGITDITAFKDNPDVTDTNWTSVDGGLPEPFGNDDWSDGGVGFPIEPVPGNENVYQWVDMNLLGRPTFLQGEIFGVALKNLGPVLEGSSVVWHASGVNPQWGWKYYANGRTSNDPTTAGWWSREFHWNYAVVVNLTGDRAPVINSFSSIPSGTDLGPYTVDADITDDNPSGGAFGVGSATLNWSNDDGTTWNPVAMTGTEPNFSGDIPAQSPDTDVLYFIEATDVESNSVSTATNTFFVFGPSGASTLVVFNGHEGVAGYPQEFYWGSGEWPANFNTLTWDHDSWAYGALTDVVVDNYTNIIEITTNGPGVINNDVIQTWIETDPSHNYLVAGDEWLGGIYGWPAVGVVTIPDGDFAKDVMGISVYYVDIMGGSAESLLPSDVFPQMGTLLGGSSFDTHAQVSADNGWTAPMTYDPVFEIPALNWMDGADFEADVEVDMMGLAVDGTTQRPIGGHRTLPAGNKIAFLAYDPLSLDSDARAAMDAQYWWYGFLDTAPQWEVLRWFGIAVGVERENNLLPDEYSLSQNYPNPFNPSTTIKFSVPQQTNVVLKVYDILGSEVANLVNETLDAGNYAISFDASQFASGMYIYKITAGNFVTTKKMMLLK